MNAVLYIAAALSAVCAVLLVIIITKLSRPSAQDGQIKELEHKVSSLEGQLRDEFERSRRESAGNQKDMRSELTESLDKMNEPCTHDRGEFQASAAADGYVLEVARHYPPK